MKYIKRNLKLVITLLLLLFMLGGQAAVPAGAFACGDGGGSSKDQVLHGVDQTGTDCSGSGVITAIKAAVTVLSIIIGAAAVIMIIISGLKYITSGGDSGKVSSAKSTLTYALIGVIIAAMAQLLVHIALYNANKSI